jgi:hypothetical protein
MRAQNRTKRMAAIVCYWCSACVESKGVRRWRQRNVTEKCLLQRRCVFVSAPVEDVPCGSHVFIWRQCWKERP